MSMRIQTERFELRVDERQLTISVGASTITLRSADALLLADALRLAASAGIGESAGAAGFGGAESAAGAAHDDVDETGYEASGSPLTRRSPRKRKSPRAAAAPSGAKRSDENDAKPRRRKRAIIGAPRTRTTDSEAGDADETQLDATLDDAGDDATRPRTRRSIIVGRRASTKTEETTPKRLWEELRDFLLEEGDPVSIERILQWTQDARILDVRHPERVIRMTLSKHPSVFHQVDGDWTAAP
ncbi:MAG: hypothetical protein KC609_17360 [Myxococcales bacterium]|nr:hypothetical protein [Myxococcales bacterium]